MDSICHHCDRSILYPPLIKNYEDKALLAVREFYINQCDLRLKDRDIDIFIMSAQNEPCMESLDEIQFFLDTMYGPIYYIFEDYNSNLVVPTRIAIVSPEILQCLKLWIAKRVLRQPIPTSTFCDSEKSEKMLTDYKRIFTVKHRNNDCYKFDPYVPALLIISGVEQNPGPVVRIPIMGITLQECGSEYIVTLANGVIVTVRKEQVDKDSNFLYLTVDNSEQLTSLVKSKRTGQIYVDMRIQRNQEVYTPHVDFQPSKRIVLKPVQAVFDSVGHTFPLEESEGRFGKIWNFNVIPRNVMRVKIGDKWCNFDKITSAKYRYLVTSIKLQMMTEKQVIEYASLITSVQMCTISVDGIFKNLLIMYAKLFFANVDLISKITRTVVHHEDAWNELFKLPVVYIPSPVFIFGSYTELMVKPLPFPTEIWSYYQLMEAMNTYPKYNFDMQDQEDMRTARTRLIKDFQRGLTVSPTAALCDLKFDFQVTHNIAMQPRQPSTDLGYCEKFIRDLVIKRLTIGDFAEACAHVLDKIEDYNQVKHIVKALSSKMFHYSVTANLQRLLMKNVLDKPPHDIEKLDNIPYSYNSFPIETQVARRMQLEYQVFCTELGWDSKKNVFNNVDTIKEGLHCKICSNY